MGVFVDHLDQPMRRLACRELTLADPRSLSTRFKRTCPQDANRFISKDWECIKLAPDFDLYRHTFYLIRPGSGGPSAHTPSKTRRTYRRV